MIIVEETDVSVYVISFMYERGSKPVSQFAVFLF